MWCHLLQLFHDVGKCRQSHLGGDIFPDVNLLAHGLVADQVGDGASLVAGHLLHHMIAFGVYGTIVKWILGIGNAQETGTLLIGCRPQPRHFLQLRPAAERPVLTSVGDNVLGQRRPQSADISQQVL